MVLTNRATGRRPPRLHSSYVALNPPTTGCGRIRNVRRTLCLTLLLVAAGALVAGAYATTPAAEGNLSIKRGDGLLILDMRGAAVGRIGRGDLIVQIPASRECGDLKVWGADEEEPSEFEIVDGEPVVICGYSGSGIRFRLVGKLGLEITNAHNLFLSAAGRGEGWVEGLGGADGVWSLNGRKERSLPNTVRRFDLLPDEDARSANAAG